MITTTTTRNYKNIDFNKENQKKIGNNLTIQQREEQASYNKTGNSKITVL